MADGGFEIYLKTTHDGKGELRFDALGALAISLQTLQTRIGRHLVDRGGPGRTAAALEALTTLRITGLSGGSTTLKARRGDDGALPLDLSLDHDLDERFQDIVAGIREGRRPAWADDLLAESAGQVLDALQRVDGTATFKFVGRPWIVMDTARLDRSAWIDRRGGTRIDLDVVGVLYSVNLETRSFRLRDDVGFTFVLPAVAEAAVVYRLVGTRVRATGRAVPRPDGTLVADPGAEITAVELPAEWFRGQAATIGEIVRSAAGPDPDGGVELSDEEFDAFLSSIHG